MLQPIGWTIEEDEWLYEYLNRYTTFIILSIQSEWNSLLRLAAFDLGAHFKKHFSLGKETIEQRFFRTNGFKYFKIAHNIFVESNAAPVDLSNEHGYHPDNPVYLNSVYDGDVLPGFDPLPRGLWMGSLGGDGVGASRVDGGDGAGPSGVDADEDVEPGGLP
ncbi:hypothetical protein DH2020_018069 [Rehmannia glutinosa]|uniref:Uncharacterized protein n=1 Tax=Rehmannia glutinosa TaxID=99300 RepID=A0ABR0WIA0_REHGL